VTGNGHLTCESHTGRSEADSFMFSVRMKRESACRRELVRRDRRTDRTPFSGQLLLRGSLLDSISLGFKRFGWGAVPERAMRPFVVVVVPPVLDQGFRFV